MLLENGRRRAKPSTRPKPAAGARLPWLRGPPKPLSPPPPSRPLFDFDEYVRKATIAHEERLRRQDTRLTMEASKRRAADRKQAKMVNLGRQHDEQRRQCISSMRNTLGSPIRESSSGDRLGCSRIVPLYVAERLLELQARPMTERQRRAVSRGQGSEQGKMMASAPRFSWPRATSPRTPSTHTSPVSPIPPLSPSSPHAQPCLSPQTQTAIEHLELGLLAGVGRSRTPHTAMRAQLHIASSMSLPELSTQTSMKSMTVM